MNKEYFINKLTKVRPTNFEIYNYDLVPLTFHHTDKIPITCKHHGLFYQIAYSHLSGTGCRKCFNQETSENKTLGIDAFIKKSRSKFGNKFDYSKTIYTKKGIDLIITCPEHGDFSIRPEAHIWSIHGCPECDYVVPRRIKQQKFIEQAKEIHGNKYDYSKVNFINVTDNVEIICSIHGSFWQSPYSHINTTHGCQACAREADRLSQDDFITISNKVHDNKYNYDKVNYVTNTSMVTITCKEHGDFVQRASSHLAGCGCKKCFVDESKHSTEEFIKIAKEIHGNKYDYSKVDYQTNKIPVEIICSIHGSFWQIPNAHTSPRNGCPSCNESKGENLVESFLKKYNLNHIREYKVSPYNYRYDFYLPELNIFIEFNGFQHYSPVDFFGGEEGFRKTRKNDIIKKQIVKDNNGKLVIITYLHLNENTIEKQLIGSLKRLYKYWFVIDGKVTVFKDAIEVIKAFNIPGDVLIRDLLKEVEKKVKGLKVLF